MNVRAFGMAVLLAATTVIGSAQDEQAHNTAMKAGGKLMDSLRKNLEAKQLDAAAKDAREMADAFGPVETFWASKNLTQAVDWSRGVQTASKEIITAAGANNAEAAAAGMKSLGSNCRGCHTQHREKLPDGKYKFKY